ncbi:MAG: leucine-rich repeat domain-containing protein [Oscillospiraceae bacterium]
MANIIENVTRASTAFDKIKSAIEGKGVQVGNSPVEEYAGKISEISAGEGQEVLYNTDGRMYTRSIVIPDDVTSIGGQAYYKCTEVSSVTIGSGVTTINNNAFQGCNSLTEIYIPEGVTTIKQNAFFNDPIETIYLPATLSSMGAAVFSTMYFRNVTLGQGFDISLNIALGTYTVDCMLAMLEALKDNTGLEAKTLTLGSKNLANLTEEEKQIATDKNWNLA